ncbi:hypothetical protein HYQ46_000138 [Verticillium longisporum]|nr:hypothetical protein HYQ46_000138 [Verticillium longisporum]
MRGLFLSRRQVAKARRKNIGAGTSEVEEAKHLLPQLGVGFDGVGVKDVMPVPDAGAGEAGIGEDGDEQRQGVLPGDSIRHSLFTRGLG